MKGCDMMNLYIFYKSDTRSLYAFTTSKKMMKEFENTRDMSKFIKSKINMTKEEYESDFSNLNDTYQLKHFELKDEKCATKVLSTEDEISDIKYSLEDTFMYLLSKTFGERDVDTDIDFSIFKNKYTNSLCDILKLDMMSDLMKEDDRYIPWNYFSYNELTIFCELYKDLYRGENKI